MPKLSLYPTPKKRYYGGRWRIVWRYNKKQYNVPTDHVDEKRTASIDTELRQFSACLASDEPTFPEKYLRCECLYCGQVWSTHGRVRERPVQHDNSELYKRFKRHAKLEYSRGWYTAMVGHLDALQVIAGDLGSVTPAIAREFLAGILDNENKPANRNRGQSACSTFYNWLVQGEYVSQNPFAGIKQLREAHGEKDIVYCTKDERERIIAMARDSEWPDWLAVPIAFYAGIRKGEIARVKWSDVLFDEGRIIVPITKTKERRVLPLPNALRKMLEEVPENRRHGYVVAMPPEFDRVFRLENLHRKIKKLNKGFGRFKDGAKNKTESERDKKAIPDERIAWNAWRHTFGSLLAQAGVSLDKISSWMGNTPDACRRHYAQFVPRGVHDEDIEKL